MFIVYSFLLIFFRFLKLLQSWNLVLYVSKFLDLFPWQIIFGLSLLLFFLFIYCINLICLYFSGLRKKKGLFKFAFLGLLINCSCFLFLGIVSFFSTVTGIPSEWKQFSDLFSLNFGIDFLSVAFLLILFFLNCSLYLLIFRYLKHNTLVKQETKPLSQAGLCSGILAIIFPISLILFLVFIDQIPNTCYDTAVSRFHEFNAHLKDVCDERVNQKECPQNESDLAEFNPKGYQQINICAKTFYNFDTVTQQHTWMMRINNEVFISHSHFYPGFGFYYLPTNSIFTFQYGLPDKQIFPPSFPGPWGELPK